VDLIDISIRWFDHWLKGLDNMVDRDPSVQYFVMGLDKWRTATTWPPEETEDRLFFLSHTEDARELTKGHLQPEADSLEVEDHYSYDPKNPVSTLWSSDLFTSVSDRRQLEHREDILIYRSSPLEIDVEIAGVPRVSLYARSSAPDTVFLPDWLMNILMAKPLRYVMLWYGQGETSEQSGPRRILDTRRPYPLSY